MEGAIILKVQFNYLDLPIKLNGHNEFHWNCVQQLAYFAS